MDRGTERRHWKESQTVSKPLSGLDEFCEPLLVLTVSPTESSLSDKEEHMDEDMEGMQYDSIN